MGVSRADRHVDTHNRSMDMKLAVTEKVDFQPVEAHAPLKSYIVALQALCVSASSLLACFVSDRRGVV